MSAKNITLAVLAVLFLILIFQNYQTVDVSFFFWSASLSKSLLISGSLLLGLIVGWLLKSIRTRKSRAKPNRMATQR